jgi:hypothetical protein
MSIVRATNLIPHKLVLIKEPQLARAFFYLDVLVEVLVNSQLPRVRMLIRCTLLNLIVVLMMKMFTSILLLLRDNCDIEFNDGCDASKDSDNSDADDYYPWKPLILMNPKA